MKCTNYSNNTHTHFTPMTEIKTNQLHFLSLSYILVKMLITGKLANVPIIQKSSILVK